MEASIVNLLNTIPADKFRLNNYFFDSMEYMHTHLLHMPDFYGKQIRNIFANKNGELDPIKADKMCIAYGAHKEVYGN